jgi:4-hydroxybenzoate polyprenyltransferase
MLALYWRLLRYRISLMTVLFMLLGAAWQRDVAALGWPMVLVALASRYVSATSVNDIADEEIDEINHPDDHSRPFIAGTAGTRDLWLAFGLASFGAVCGGDILLTSVLADRLWLVVLVQSYVVGAMVMLYRRYRVDGRKDEQLAIGVGAKMGNGLLATLLGT